MSRSKSVHDYVGLFLTAAVSIVGTLGTVKMGLVEVESQQQATIVTNQTALYARIESLEDRIEVMNQQRIADRVQIVMLEAQLRAKPDPLRALYTYVEGLETPAWLKMHYPVEEEFRMLYVNRRYEDFYRISRERYIDATDFDVHPATVAAEYYDNDMKVLHTKDFMDFVEMAPDRSSPKTMIPTRFWKFYLRLPDGRELIAGIQVGPVKME